MYVVEITDHLFEHGKLYVEHLSEIADECRNRSNGKCSFVFNGESVNAAREIVNRHGDTYGLSLLEVDESFFRQNDAWYNFGNIPD
ncbi:MAG: hypothetical protein DHS20C02_17220 [Micavibrio sp.]|nr:MAG: hypothetical protein DHS20C02_17220 [Micavibrio sp.]